MPCGNKSYGKMGSKSGKGETKRAKRSSRRTRARKR
jgi:hypothetical protein